MKIAVTYENGNVFQHFGRTENFKIYEVEDGKVVSAEVIGGNGIGHESLAGYLADQGVEKLICGGLGQGAQNALAEAGIEVIAGAQGDTDEAVAAYLRGELESTGVNCDHHGDHHHGDHHHGDHHHGEDHECCGGGEDGECCGDGEDGECCGGEEGGCGGCSGCGTPQIIYEGKNAGKKCRVHYRGTFNDGAQFDSSYDRGQTLDFISGVGMMIPGFDKAVVDMEVGQTLDIHLMPEEAYGPSDPRAIMKFRISDLMGSEGLSVGQKVYLQDQMGRPVPVVVLEKDEEFITLDANHEMA
ncbi:MAG: FKBP-type peptidyl-prolyl cis-trans isomerase, partial [Lachnospiraceae bacterium]|nr:FKBP-type peptidyl-prolyl cis-trans isomerase [Lachnospiraceae bacterium]